LVWGVLQPVEIKQTGLIEETYEVDLPSGLGLPGFGQVDNVQKVTINGDLIANGSFGRTPKHIGHLCPV